jgi:cytochrome c oxidase cbb3-type subunit IV
MALFTFLGSATTVLAFVAFIGIVVWAYSSRRKQAFDEAANAPFALPDDVYDGAQSSHTTNGNRAERRS